MRGQHVLVAWVTWATVVAMGAACAGAEAQPRLRDDEGVMRAAADGDVKRLEAMLKAEPALAHARVGADATPLIVAARSGQEKAVALLLAARAGRRAVMQALVAAGARVAALLRAKADVNARDWAGASPLDRASDPDVAAALREAGGRSMRGLPRPDRVRPLPAGPAVRAGQWDLLPGAEHKAGGDGVTVTTRNVGGKMWREIRIADPKLTIVGVRDDAKGTRTFTATRGEGGQPRTFADAEAFKKADPEAMARFAEVERKADAGELTGGMQLRGPARGRGDRGE